MSIETLIKTTFSNSFRKELYPELKAGKLLNPEFKKNIAIGDEVDVQFDGGILLEDYTGGDLNIDNVETAQTTTVKVKINRGKSVIFKLDDAKLRQIKNAKNDEERIKLATAYSQDAREQFARGINQECCKQYVRAGKVITNKAGNPITLTEENVHKVFAKAKAELKKGDGKHTAWVDGQMLAVIDTDMEAFMSTQKLLQYSDVMAKHYEKGFVGTFLGFAVIVDDDIQKDKDGNSYPLFGREKRTIAGGVQDEFNLESGKKVGGFDIHYWGKGVYGIKAPLAYLLVSAKVKSDFQIEE